MIVGVLGGIGSGKSTVTRMFVEMGAEALDADQLAHEVLETPEARSAVARWLGEHVVGPDGRVDRGAVARTVFSDPLALGRLESIVHPEVLRRIDERVTAHERGEDDCEMLVLDVPLLPRLPLKDRCDFLVFVEAPLPEREERVAARGWPAGEIERRESFQPSNSQKKRIADFVVENRTDLAETSGQVRRLYETMRRRYCERAEGKERKPGG